MLERWLTHAFRPKLATWVLVGFADVLSPGRFALAQEPPSSPPAAVVTLRYRELTNSEEFKYKVLGQGESTRFAGLVHF